MKFFNGFLLLAIPLVLIAFLIMVSGHVSTATNQTILSTINGSNLFVNNSSGNVINTVEKYNPRTNTWSTVASMPTARYYLAAAVSG